MPGSISSAAKEEAKLPQELSEACYFFFTKITVVEKHMPCVCVCVKTQAGLKFTIFLPCPLQHVPSWDVRKEMEQRKELNEMQKGWGTIESRRCGEVGREREKEPGVGIASETNMDVCLVIISCPIL